MAYDNNTKIITAPISVKNVQDCLASSLSSLGALIASAKIGGVGGYAFKINENASDTEMPSGINRGELIPGSLPKWNIFSANAPGEWFTKGGSTVQGYIAYRLKDMLGGTSQGYAFMLHEFDNYKHLAIAPSVYGQDTLTIDVYDGVTSPLNADYYASFGDYRFEDITGFTNGKIGIALCRADGSTVTQGYVSYTAVPHGDSVNIQWTIPVNVLNVLTNGQKLYPKLWIASSSTLASDNDRFFIQPFNEAIANPVTVNKRIFNKPTFGGLYLDVIDYNEPSPTIVRYTLSYNNPTINVGDTSISISNIISPNYTSQEGGSGNFVRNRYAECQANGGSWGSSHLITDKAIFDSSPDTEVFYIDGGAQYNTSYDFRIFHTIGIAPLD